MLFVWKTYYLNISAQKFKCDTCNSVYFGKTKRHLLVREYEHSGFIRFYGKGIKVHRKRCYSNQKTLKAGTTVNYFHLKLKESLLILKMKPRLNIAQESMPLCLFDNYSWNAIGRSSYQRCSIEIGVFKTFTKFTQIHRVNFVKFLRTPFLRNTSTPENCLHTGK